MFQNHPHPATERYYLANWHQSDITRCLFLFEAQTHPRSATSKPAHYDLCIALTAQMVRGKPALRGFNAKSPVMQNKKNPDYACNRRICHQR